MAEKVDLNQGAIKEAGQSSPTPNSKEMQEIKMIKSWYADSNKWRKDWEVKWKSQDAVYYNKLQQTTSDKILKTNINIVRPTVQTVVPLMTDAKPKFGIIPEEPGDIDFTEMVGENIEALWDRQSMPIKMVEIITEMCIRDASVLKVPWNSDLQDGLGDIEYEPIDITKLWVNKECIDFDRKFKYAIEEITKTVGEWKRLFPKLADKIKPDTSGSRDDKQGDKAKGAYGDGITLVSPADQDRNKSNDPGNGTMMDDNNVATGWQVWYVDDVLEEYIEGEKDKETKVLKKKYPNGHLTTLLPNQNLILSTGENPYEGDTYNPYVKFIDTIVPRCFYGEGEVGPLMPIQSYVNRTAKIIMEYLRLMSNPVWILDKTSGVNAKGLTNKIGLIIKKEPGSEVKRDFPASIPAYVFTWLETLLRLGETQSGVQEVTQGRKPAGVTAAEAIETLQEAAQTRIRLKDRNLENSLNQLGRMTSNRMMQFERGVRKQVIDGPIPDRPTFIEYTIDPIEEGEETVGYKMTKIVTEFDPQTGEYKSPETRNASTNMKQFNFKVKSGTSLPFQKAQKGQRAIQLFDRGAIDRKELLDSYDWPNPEEVLARVEEQEQAAAEQAAAQQGVVQ